VKLSLPGLNIQHPISQLIATGDKIVETRTYKMPDQYQDLEVLLIETPGKSGGFKARAIARITFGPSFKYKSKTDFRSDVKRHRVNPGSAWDWESKGKWGWPIIKMTPLKSPIEIKQKRGIVFTKSLSIEI
jgi:hypothetical protein